MNRITPEQLKALLEKRANAPKRYYLHCHPEAIKRFVSELHEGADEPLKPIIEDIQFLVEWALARLPLVEEKKEEGKKPSSERKEKKFKCKDK